MAQVAERTEPTRKRRERSIFSMGWVIVARKEFADHLTSVRFTILIVIVGLAAVAAVYSAAGGIREAAEGIGSSENVPGLFLKLFTVTPEGSRLPAFFQGLALLAPLFGIAFGFDAVNGERAQGTLPRLISQPIYRDDVINGKFVAGLAVIALAIVTLTAAVVGIGLVRIGVVPTLSDLTRLIVWLLVTVIYIGFWLALSTLFSVVLRRAATSALAAFAAWVVASLFAILLIGIVADVVSPLADEPTAEQVIQNARTQRNLSLVFPQALYQEATVALLEPEQRTFDILGLLVLQSPGSGAIPGPLSLEQSLLIAAKQVTVLVGLTVACFVAAYVSFMRQEVRA